MPGLGPTGPENPADYMPAQKAPGDPARASSSPTSPGQSGAPGKSPTAGDGASSRAQLTEPASKAAEGAGSAAGKVAAESNPGARAANAAQELKDAKDTGGASGAAEKAGAIAGREGLRALDTYATGGVIQKIPGVNKLMDTIGEKFGGQAVKAALRGTQVLLGVAALTILALVGSSITNAGPNLSGGADAPSDDQCDSMPEGWCDVLYTAQLETASGGFATPWTVLAGLAKVQTDYGRTSPYDTVDRAPDRPIPPYLQANFAATALGSGEPVGGTTNTQGTKAWGGFSNGQIPADQLCGTYGGNTLACEAAAALEQLNVAFVANFGHDICLNDGYRDLAGQNAALAKYGSPRAAKPGTSNHGWGKAIDVCQGAGASGAALSYSSAEYVWLKANAGTYGWYHPAYMEPNGKGPHEAWHWEFGGLTSTAPAAAVLTASGAQSTTCDVALPSVAIGGDGAQAAGPFLLNPGAVAQMLDDGLDPQDACDSATFVAQTLAEVGREKFSDEGLPEDEDDPNAAAVWWQAVVAAAGIFADPTTTSGSCVVAGDDPESYPISQLIDETWRCMIAQAGELHLVQSAFTDASGAVSFTEYDRSDAAAVLLAEARQVAWAASKFDNSTCDESAEYAGIFPMTAAQAASVNGVSRCDPQDNIRAAAALVLAGEAVPVAQRSTAGGPYAPMLGGWAAFPAALGQDATLLAVIGPRAEWSLTDACQAVLEPFVKAVAAPGSAMATYADTTYAVTATTMPDYLTASALSGQRDAVLADPACANATTTDLYSAAARLAEGLVASVPGLELTRPGDAQEATGAATTVSAEAVTSPAAWDPLAMSGSARAFAAAAQAPTSTAAVWGQDSVLGRLATSAHLIETAPSSDFTPSTTATSWMVQATEWAIFLGGLFPGQDTFTTRIGSLQSSLAGTGMVVAGTGSASVQAQAVIEAAKAFLGTPYSWGGGGPAGPSTGIASGANIVGFDCSGLTEYAFAKAGYAIGGTTSVQSKVGEAVASLDEAQPGDLLFFGSPIHHVAIYLGNGQLLHAPKPGKSVEIIKVYDTPSSIRRVIKETSTSGTLDSWISSALSVLYQNGFPKGTDDTAALKLIIDHESSGDPNSVNTWDSNAKAGHPSFGLMQTIPSTFDANALPGYTNKADPVAQIIAGARYAQSRYQGLDNVPGVKAVREGRSYVGY